MFRVFFGIAFFFVYLNLNAQVKIHRIKGDVEFLAADNKRLSLKEGDIIESRSSLFKKLSLKKEDSIEGEVTIKTSSSSEVELIYDDGMMIFLSENSSFTINKRSPLMSWILDLFTTRLYADDQTWFDYLYGKAMFFVKKLDKSYTVRTPHAVIGVRGTNFSVLCNDDLSEIGLFKGSIEVEKDGEKAVLKPGESAFVTKQDLKIEKRLSSFMEKERERALKLERYFENVMLKIKRRDERVGEKIRDLNKKLKQ